MFRQWRSALVIGVVGVLLTSVALAETSKVYGTVRNESGNPVPKAVVALVAVNAVESSESIVLSVTTGDDGRYSFPQIQPGTYYVRAMLSDREIGRSSPSEVTVGSQRLLSVLVEDAAINPPPPPQPVEQKPQVAELQPVTPAPATGTSKPADTTTVASNNDQTKPAVEPKPTVKPVNPIIGETAKVLKAQVVFNDMAPSIGYAVTREQLQTLPLYNRNFLVLGLLTPNTHDVESSSSLAGGSFSVAGVRGSSNSFLLDGIDNVASSSGQAIPFQVNDSIREFRVTSANAGAEYGRNSGGVVDVITNRAQGTRWHGSAFGYFGWDKFDATAKVSPYSGTSFDRAAAFAGDQSASAPIFTTGYPLPTGQPVKVYTPLTYNQYVNAAKALGYQSNPVGTNLNAYFNPTDISSKLSNHVPYNSQQFGANLGGPITKKLYLFGSYEGTRINNPNSILERVPSGYDRQLATLTGGGTIAQALSNVTGASSSYAIANKIVNLYPTANVIGVPGTLEFYKGQAENYTHVDNLLMRLDWSRHVGEHKHDYALRYSTQNLNQLHDATLPTQPTYAGNGAIRDALNQSGSFSITSTMSPRISNDFRIGANRFQVLESPQDKNFDATSLGLGSATMPTVFLSGLDSRYAGANCAAFAGANFVGCNPGALVSWSSIYLGNSAFLGTPAGGPARMTPTLDGQFPMARLGAPLSAPGRRRDSGLFFNDTMAITIGHHALKVGGDYRWYQNMYTNDGLSRGYITSLDIGQFTSNSNTCSGFLCTGQSTQFYYPSFDYQLKQRASNRGLLSSFAASGFIQDNISVSDRLNVSVGLRYEYFSTPVEANNQLWNYDPGANGLYRPGSSTVYDPFGDVCGSNDYQPGFLYAAARAPGSMQWNCGNTTRNEIVPTDKNTWAPRAGFAYALDKQSKTVVRGSIGFYYDQQPAQQFMQLLLNRPTLYDTAIPQALYGSPTVNRWSNSGCSPSNPVFSCGGAGNVLLNSNLAAPVSAAVLSAASVPGAIYAKDYIHAKQPFTRQASFTIQRVIGNNLGMEIGYIGTSGYKLPVVTNSNFNNEWFCANNSGTCDPMGFTPIFTQSNQGTSDYHSLMARVRGNFRKFSFNATYTFSKGMDNVAASEFPTLTQSALSYALGLAPYGNGGFTPVQAYPHAGLFNTGVVANFLTTLPVLPPLPDLSTGALTTTGAGRILTTPYNISQDPLNWGANDWGRSDFDATHRLVVDYSWKFGRKGSKMLGDWMVSSIVVAQSGQPYTIFSGPYYGEMTQRANLSQFKTTGDPTRWVTVTGVQALPSVNCSAGLVIGTPFSGTAGKPCTGTSPRNGFTGPNYINNDLAVQKQIALGDNESRYVTFRSEFYNLFNRANYYNPNSVLSLDGFNINPDFGKVKSAHNPLQMQFAVRFVF